MVGKSHKDLIWDAKDAIDGAKTAHAPNHCDGCDRELGKILDEFAPEDAQLEWELKGFAKRLQRKKLERGCLGCHPPNYRDWDIGK